MRSAGPTPRLRGEIGQMVSIIVEKYNPEKIVLFGSHARGNPRPDSDVDLLIIMPVEASRREASVRIGVDLCDIPVSKDIIVFTPDDVHRFGNLVGTILRPALREGIVLYERC